MNTPQLHPSSSSAELDIDQVFVSWDSQALLFSGHDSSGQHYLVNFVDSDERGDTFLYLPISQARLAAAASGQLSLREAFVDAEDGSVLVVRNGKLSRGVKLASSAIKSDWLPEKGVRLQASS